MELIQDLLPGGVINVINGSGSALGRPLVEHDDIGKVAFTGSTATGQRDHGIRPEEHHPHHDGARRQVAQCVLDDVARAHDEYYAKAIEGFTMFALNKGEICSCPSRALLQDGLISGGFLDDSVARVKRITVGNPSTPQRRWVRRTARTSSTRSRPTSSSALRRAQPFSPGGGAGRDVRRLRRRLLPRADRLPPVPTTCAFSRRKSSGPS